MEMDGHNPELQRKARRSPDDNRQLARLAPTTTFVSRKGDGGIAPVRDTFHTTFHDIPTPTRRARCENGATAAGRRYHRFPRPLMTLATTRRRPIHPQPPPEHAIHGADEVRVVAETKRGEALQSSLRGLHAPQLPRLAPRFTTSAPAPTTSPPRPPARAPVAAPRTATFIPPSALTAIHIHPSTQKVRKPLPILLFELLDDDDLRFHRPHRHRTRTRTSLSSTPASTSSSSTASASTTTTSTTTSSTPASISSFISSTSTAPPLRGHLHLLRPRQHQHLPVLHPHLDPALLLYLLHNHTTTCATTPPHHHTTTTSFSPSPSRSRSSSSATPSPAPSIGSPRFYPVRARGEVADVEGDAGMRRRCRMTLDRERTQRRVRSRQRGAAAARWRCAQLDRERAEEYGEGRGRLTRRRAQRSGTLRGDAGALRRWVRNGLDGYVTRGERYDCLMETSGGEGIATMGDTTTHAVDGAVQLHDERLTAKPTRKRAYAARGRMTGKPHKDGGTRGLVRAAGEGSRRLAVGAMEGDTGTYRGANEQSRQSGHKSTTDPYRKDQGSQKSSTSRGKALNNPPVGSR
ncbi:hypothetical protein C8J57DRAFT_1512769 [Mycena rebaudengoi]|nr:hypothetical protein C8J57DRAFT_1512769 [Mycena rebaudengoi]